MSRIIGNHEIPASGGKNQGVVGVSAEEVGTFFSEHMLTWSHIHLCPVAFTVGLCTNLLRLTMERIGSADSFECVSVPWSFLNKGSVSQGSWEE